LATAIAADQSQTAKIEAIDDDPIAFAKQAPIATYTPEPVEVR
jgi:hypothetical protein